MVRSVNTKADWTARVQIPALPLSICAVFSKLLNLFLPHCLLFEIDCKELNELVNASDGGTLTDIVIITNSI